MKEEAVVTERAASVSAGREFLPAPPPKKPWATVLVGFLLVVAFFASLLPLGMCLYYGFVQRELTFVVDEGGLSVRFGVGRIDIPLSDIAFVQYVADPPHMGRVGGAGMAGLQMGWFHLPGYGRVYRLTTAARPVVYVDTRPDAAQARPGLRYVFNPQDPERFVALLEALRAGQAATPAPAEFRPAPAASVFGDALLIAVIVFTLPVGALCLYFVVHRLAKGPRAMVYRVGPDGIGVRHFRWRLYKWESVRGVRRFDEPLSRVWRTIGVSMPGYYAGDFTVRPLGAVALYVTRLAPPLVLVDTKLGKVLISPEDVEGFLAAVEEYRPKAN